MPWFIDRIRGLSAPINNDEPATKGYVDRAVLGITQPYLVLPGVYYDNSNGTALHNNPTSANTAANRITIMPYKFDLSIPAVQIGVIPTTAIAGGLVRIALYSRNQETGQPENLLFATGDINASAANTFAFAPISFTFQAGVPYYVALWTNSAFWLRVNPIGAAQEIIPWGSAATNLTYCYMAWRTATFAGGTFPSTLSPLTTAEIYPSQNLAPLLVRIFSA